MPEYRKQFLREKGIDPDKIEDAALKTFLGFSDMGLTTEETGEVMYELACFYISRLIAVKLGEEPRDHKDVQQQMQGTDRH